MYAAEKDAMTFCRMVIAPNFTFLFTNMGICTNIEYAAVCFYTAVICRKQYIRMIQYNDIIQISYIEESGVIRMIKAGIIGATGYDLQSGINTPDSREANKKRIIKENSSEVYVLADSSKSGKRTMCKAMELSECTIITEQETELLKEHANYILAKD